MTTFTLKIDGDGDTEAVALALWAIQSEIEDEGAKRGEGIANDAHYWWQISEETP